MKKVNGLLLGGAMALSFAGVISATSATKDVKEVKADDEDVVLMIGTHDMIAEPTFSSGGGTATYDSSTRTLTLTNFSYSDESYVYTYSTYAGFYVSGLEDLKIKLSGNNVIKGLYNSDNANAIVNGGIIDVNTTISALDPTGEKPSLSFVTAQSTAMSQYYSTYGIFCAKSLSLSGIVFNSYTESAAKSVNCGFYGGWVDGTLTITNSVTRFESSDSEFGTSAGIIASCSLDFSNSTVRAIGHGGANSYGVRINTSGCKKVDITESNVEAIAGTATTESTGFAMQTVFSISKSNFVATGEHYGFNSLNSSPQTVTIGNDMKRFTISGKTRAASSKISIVNAFAGYGWEDAAGTGEASNINVTPGGAIYNFKRISFGKISYTATACEAVAYDGLSHQMLTVTVSDPTSDSVVKYKKDGDTDYSLSIPYESEIGDHTVYYQIEAKDYTTVNGSVVFTINKASTSWTTLPVGATNLKYDQTEKNLLVTEAVASNGTVSYTLNGVLTDVSDLKATNAGTYTIVAHANVDDEHEPLVDIELQVEIEAADLLNVSHTITGTKEYNGEELIPLYSRSAATYYDDPISWLYSLTEDGEYTNIIPTFTDAGDHTFYWKVVAPNHKPQGGSVVFTITPANLSDVSVSVETSEFIYDGQAKQLSVQTTGTAVDETAVTFKYSLNEESGFETTLPTLTNAGEYTVYWKAEAANHNTVTGSFDVTINKAASSYQEEPSAIAGLAYTGEPLELVEAGETDDGVIKYCVGDKEGTYSDVIPSGTEPGTYVVWYMVEGDSNHLDSELKSVTVTIGENDKTSLNKAIENGDKLHELIKDKYPEIDGPLATALTEGKAVKENTSALPKDITDATTKINEACVSVIEKLVESIGEVKNDEQSKESLEIARAAYESLSAEQKLLVPEKTLADLEAKEAEYKKVTSGLAWWAIVLIVVACLAVVFAIAYCLLFFVFNKWIKKDDKAIRVFPLGKKDEQVRLFTMCCKVEYRKAEEVYKSKSEALK